MAESEQERLAKLNEGIAKLSDNLDELRAKPTDAIVDRILGLMVSFSMHVKNK